MDTQNSIKPLIPSSAKLVLLLLLSIISLLSRAQDSRENLVRNLKISKADSSRIEILHELGKSYLHERIQSHQTFAKAIAYFKWAMMLSDSLGRKSDKYEQMCRLGETYFAQNDAATGQNYFFRVIREYQTAADKKREARTWLRLAKQCTSVKSLFNAHKLYLRNALSLYTVSGDLNGVTKVQIERADDFIYSGRADSAETVLLGALETGKSINFPALSDIYGRLSLVYRNTGKLDLALFNGQKKLQNLESRNFSKQFSDYALTYHDMAQIYLDLYNPDDAIRYFKLSIEACKIAKYRGYVTEIFLSVNGLVIAYIQKNDTKSALAEIKKLSREFAPANSEELGAQSEFMGRYCVAIGNYVLAEKYFIKMKSLYEKNSDPRFGPYSNKLLTTFYIKAKKFEVAKFGIKNDSLTQQDRRLPFAHRIQQEQNLYLLDSANGNLISAISHLKNFKRLNDSVFNVEKSRQISEMQERFRSKENLHSINLLKTRQVLQRKELQQLNAQKTFTITAAAALFVFLCFAIYGVISKQENNRKLKKIQEEISLKNQELEKVLDLKDSLIDQKDILIQEKEWLVKEVHHRVKNNLQIVMSLLRTQSAFLKDKSALNAITDSSNRVHSIALIHQKLYGDVNMTNIDTRIYIHDLVKHLKHCYDVKENRISMLVSVVSLKLDVSQAVPLGLILNESITNSIKHGFTNGQKGTINISLCLSDEDCLILSVVDNGTSGVPYKTLDTQQSMGTRMMQALVKQLNGTLTTDPSNGYRVVVQFPYTQNLV